MARSLSISAVAFGQLGFETLDSARATASSFVRLVQPAGRNDPIPCWAQAARGLPVLVQRNGLARVLLK